MKRYSTRFSLYAYWHRNSTPPFVLMNLSKLSDSLMSSPLLQISSLFRNILCSFLSELYRLYTVDNFGLFFIDDRYDYIKNRLRKNILWEPHIIELIQKCALPASVVIDVGAHIGTHVIGLSQLVGKERLCMGV